MGRIVVVGAGIAGLGAALFLARDGHEVTVCEIDGPPPPGIDELWSDWPRPNVPQGWLGHAFLAGFCAELRARAPDVLAEHPRRRSGGRRCERASAGGGTRSPGTSS